MIFRLLLLCAAVMAAYAQDFRATLQGRITDQSGAVVTGARIAAVNTETGSTYATQSNDSGLYSLPALPPGRYSVSVELAGFKRIVREGLVLEVQARPQVDAVLEPGDIQTSVSVTAEAPLLETSTASRAA